MVSIFDSLRGLPLDHLNLDDCGCDSKIKYLDGWNVDKQAMSEKFYCPECRRMWWRDEDGVEEE